MSAALTRLCITHFCYLLFWANLSFKSIHTQSTPLANYDIYFIGLLSKLPCAGKIPTSSKGTKQVYLLTKWDKDSILEKKLKIDYGFSYEDIRIILGTFLEKRADEVNIKMNKEAKQRIYRISSDSKTINYLKDDWYSIPSSYNFEKYAHYFTMTWKELESNPGTGGYYVLDEMTLRFLIVDQEYGKKDEYTEFSNPPQKKGKKIYDLDLKNQHKEISLIKLLDKMFYRFNQDNPEARYSLNEYYFHSYAKDPEKSPEEVDHVIEFKNGDIIHKVYNPSNLNVSKQYIIREKNDLSTISPLISFLVIEGTSTKKFMKADAFFETHADQWPNYRSILNSLDYHASFTKKRAFFDNSLPSHTPFGWDHDQAATNKKGYKTSDFMEYHDDGFYDIGSENSSIPITSHFTISQLKSEQLKTKNYHYVPWHLSYKKAYKVLLQSFSITHKSDAIEIIGIPTILLDQKLFFQKRKYQEGSNPWKACNPKENIYYGIILCDSLIRAGKKQNTQSYENPFHEQETIKIILQANKTPIITHYMNNKPTKNIELLTPSKTSNTPPLPQTHSQRNTREAIPPTNNGLGTTGKVTISLIGLTGALGTSIYYIRKVKNKSRQKK